MKHKTFTRLLCLLICLLMMSAVPVSAAVPSDDAIMPLWNSIYSVEVSIVFDGTTGVPGGIASKQSTADSIEGTLTVYAYVDDEWVYVTHWYNKVTNGTLVVTGEFDGVSGIRYKAVFDVVAYTDGVAETASFYHTKTCPTVVSG